MPKLFILLLCAIVSVGCVHAGVKGGVETMSDTADGSVFIEAGFGAVVGIEYGTSKFSYDTANGQEAARHSFINPYIGLVVPVDGDHDVVLYFYVRLGMPMVSGMELDSATSGDIGIGMSFFEEISIDFGYREISINGAEDELGVLSSTVYMSFGLVLNAFD
jgi:hypothetical protein